MRPRAIDPYFANVVSLCHFNGTNGSTTFTDQIAARSWSVNTGSPTLNTGTKKYGSAALSSGSTGGIKCPDHADFEFGTGDFTIEFWLNVFNNPASFGWAITKHVGGTFGPYAISCNNVRELNWQSSSDGAAAQVNFTSTGGPQFSTNVFTHIAYVREGTTFRGYIGGVQKGSGTSSISLLDNSTHVVLGENSDGNQALDCFIDDLRVTKGVCRYPGGTTFTPATAEFPDL